MLSAKTFITTDCTVPPDDTITREAVVELAILSTYLLIKSTESDLRGKPLSGIKYVTGKFYTILNTKIRALGPDLTPSKIEHVRRLREAIIETTVEVVKEDKLGTNSKLPSQFDVDHDEVKRDRIQELTTYIDMCKQKVSSSALTSEAFETEVIRRLQVRFSNIVLATSFMSDSDISGVDAGVLRGR